MIRILLLSIVLSLGAISLLAQEVKFRNPSFEGMAGANRMPRKWVNCGFLNESPPDVHPDPALTFDVRLLPYDGRTYLGMVTRDNNTWEAAGAQLNGPLRRGQCYRFEIALTSSDSYRSLSRTTNVPVNYTAPIRLKIWGGNDYCDGQELLATSPEITPGQWAIYTFVIQPQMGDYTTITFSADYPEETEWATNGNLLLDAASSFLPLASCDDVEIPQSEAPAKVEATPIVLRLPGADFFAEEENQQVFLANILRDFQFLEDATLADNSFQLEEETEVRRGSPQLYALLHALQHTSGKRWELVVYDGDPVQRDLKLLNLGASMPAGPEVNMAIYGYDADRYDGASWYCMAIANGLYLRVVEE